MAGAAKMNGSELNSHYDTLGSTYEDAFFYEAGEYNSWMIDRLLEALKFEGNENFADVGGGTGHIATALADKSGLSHHLITVIEPSKSMADQAISRNIHTKIMDAVSWATHGEEVLYDRILMKEMIHHVPLEQRRAMWASVFTDKLSPNGIVCIVTRPKDNIDYPFFKAAHEVWTSQSESVEELRTDLSLTGFIDIKVELCAFPCKISVDRWLSMVKNKFWSTFDNFDDASLELGCAEIRDKYEGQSDIEFEDRIYFVTATRPP